MSLASATGNTWKETRWMCEQYLGLHSQQDACRAIIWSSIGNIQPVLENSGFEAALADCTQPCNHGIRLGLGWVGGEGSTSGDPHWSHEGCAGHNSTARAETSLCLKANSLGWGRPGRARCDVLLAKKQGDRMRWDTICWWPWRVPMRGGRGGHTPGSVGLGKPAGLGRAVLARLRSQLPGMLPERPWHAGPEPAATARATISPLCLVPTHPEAVSCVSYTHWEDVGFSWLRNAAARSLCRLGQWLSCQWWAGDNSDGLSPLSVCASAQATVPLQNLNPFVFHPAPNFATQEKKLMSPAGDTPTGLEK